jgi:hypothetical protein
MTKLTNGRIVAMRLRAVDAERIKTLLGIAGPYGELAGVSDALRFALKVAAESIQARS